MNQQAKYTKADIQDFNRDDNTWLISMLDVQKNNHMPGELASEKELKIRSELEMEVERDLEEEIKDSICNLSLRLHRLYQRQKDRQVKEASEDNSRMKALSEVNISIKMEGKTKVEIKETKKEATEKDRSRRYISEDMKQVSGSNGKKLDWEKTLRGGSGTVSIRDREFDKGRAKSEGFSGRGKREGKVDHKLLHLGWKV